MIDSRIILALDDMMIERAAYMADLLRVVVAGGKANDLIHENGAGVLDSLGFRIRMLDPKIHDIGNTMANCVRRYRNHAEFVTAHLSASPSALRMAAKVATQIGVKLIGITLLTDISHAQCKKDHDKSPRRRVIELTGKARRSKFHGVVCSPQEVKVVRREWPKTIIITPGVRSAGVDTHDQQRVGTPAQAVLDGADYVVVGRQITLKTTPDEMFAEALRINRQIAEATEAIDKKFLTERVG